MRHDLRDTRYIYYIWAPCDLYLRLIKTSFFRKLSSPSYFIFPSFLSEIEDLPAHTQEQLYNELLDRDAQKELEEEGGEIINWSDEVRISSRLHALWNRSAGDCLLDSVLQATWGVFDRDNALRKAMSDSLHQAGQM